MNRIKCECGHVNPEGTVLCEACGKPVEGNQHIDGNEKDKLLNMRYEGSARRSKTYNRNLVDKTWNFFSSVKVGVWLIVITLIASSLGTIFPQEMYIPPGADPATHYEEQYGLAGQIYYQLGFHNLYSSLWYMLLIALIGVSLVICSIDRVVPLHRALKKQKPKRHHTFLKRQRLFSQTEGDVDIEKFISRLKKQRYRVTRQDDSILAEKGRFSRWGPYVNHIGLIIFLLGALLRFIPAMYVDDFVWVREGETVVIPSTHGEYYVKNKNFILETYNEKENERFQAALQQEAAPVPSNYQTNAVIYKRTDPRVVGAEPELEPINEAEIRVNEPAKFNGFALYQSSFQQNEFTKMSFKLHETGNEEKVLGEFTIDLTSPKTEYELDSGARVVIDQYYPEYYLDNGEPRSKSKYPKNPAFVFYVYPPGEEKPEISFAGIGMNIDATGENDYKLNLAGFDTRDVTGLTVKKDYTLPFLGIGGLIFMIGVIQGMYWNHRRIWLQKSKDKVWIAGHTNKNWYGIKRDIEKVIEGTGIEMPEDQQQLKG
ncbi:cytochrome c biogenesis protein ResB [Thalassobacillus pellis]|uniref:cytochrome c biogenesis protein ResB n=1 Tax=Thalassobacillus pellis TaxID=748008 RepID=UPI0019616F70|nr:cytochrome c biogenesis protein ResB [Thalassobacillus pellis]MBM7552419.1 cytochrome c biogenesis protein [Thalassobacillus pellis]